MTCCKASRTCTVRRSPAIAPPQLLHGHGQLQRYCCCNADGAVPGLLQAWASSTATSSQASFHPVWLSVLWRLLSPPLRLLRLFRPCHAAATRAVNRSSAAPDAIPPGVHADNMLLADETEGAAVLVADFGLARFFRPGEARVVGLSWLQSASAGQRALVRTFGGCAAP